MRALVSLGIVAPTASGKTEVALILARALNGEVLSADSRQVYRRLDAGTAKPKGRWEGEVYRVEGVPYHLVDFLEPTETYDAGRFADQATALERGCLASSKTPIVAGGTGLYVRAWAEGLDPLPPASLAVRRKLAAAACAEGGHEALHRRLGEVDPEAARRIPPGNLHRLVRALEVYEATGRPISSFWSSKPPNGREPRGPRREAEPLFFYLEWDPELLRRRIARRSREMFPRMVEEARDLKAKGFTGLEPGLKTLGYPEAWACMEGTLRVEEGAERLIRLTCAYAKRQRTWFRHQVSAIKISVASEREGEPDRLAATILKSLGERGGARRAVP